MKVCYFCSINNICIKRIDVVGMLDDYCSAEAAGRSNNCDTFCDFYNNHKDAALEMIDAYCNGNEVCQYVADNIDEVIHMAVEYCQDNNDNEICQTIGEAIGEAFGETMDE